MFYLWIAFRNHGKGYYLPQLDNWSGRLHLSPRETGLASDVYIPVLAKDKIWTLEPPAGFFWKEKGERQRVIEENVAFTMDNGQFSIIIRAAQYTRESSRFVKYTWPQNGVITLGRDDGCAIHFANSLVSSHHITLRYQNESTCVMQESSSNGTYVNSILVRRNENTMLRFGDKITILPGLHIYFMGRVIAVNQPSAENFSVSLPLLQDGAVPDAKSQFREDEPSIFHEYHRAPRKIQQPKEESYELLAPLGKEKQNDVPTILAIGPSMTMVMPMLVSAIAMGRNNILASMAMVGTSSALAVTWGLLNRRHRDKQAILNEEHRIAVCKQYYAEMEETLDTSVRRERSRLLYNYLSVQECLALPAANDTKLWERLPSHQDFLSLRLGLGESPLPGNITIPKPQISLVDDPLRNEPQRLYDKFSIMQHVPILMNIPEHPIIGILEPRDMPYLLESMIVQATAGQSYHDIRVVVIHDANGDEEWRWAKWLPHVYTDDSHTLRMVVSHPEAIREVLSHVYDDLTIRLDRASEQADGDQEKDAAAVNRKNLPYYLVFCTDPKLIEEHPIMRIIASGVPVGCSLILQATSMEMLPKECSVVIDARNQLGAVYGMDGKMTGVQFEFPNRNDLTQYSRSISGIRIKDSMEDNAIPSLVTFLEVYKARRVEDLDAWRLWNENHAYQGIESFIGLKAGGVPFILDISDKNHGPHGLIAGTTGAGKSVLLQSYILSLAINYSPSEIQFILIDYKGGGTSEDFRYLPHVAGVIDSLQGERAIFRALASIKGEILRREEIFKQRGVNNIDDYMRLFNHDPEADSLGHLIIIIDEFAELKKEQPDFMHELVSAARVGRSLGMHLILATQKPSNSVSDEIAANTRFRVCLRVASKSDSNEMLHRPEAAYIKGMGRCYVQVGNDEIFEEVQTSYSGMDYQPDALRSDEEPQLLNESGQPIKFKKKKNADSNEKKKNELRAVLDYISDTLSEHHASGAKKLWLDELKHVLMMTELRPIQEESYADGKWPDVSGEQLLAYYAMADDVDKQQHLPVALDFTLDKNYMIVGLAGMGKTTMLQTIAVSLALRYTPDQVIMYFFSLTSRNIASLSALPHVGDIVYEEEEDEQSRLLDLLNNESRRRKKLFAQMTTSNYIQYNRAAAASKGEFKTVPAIVVFVDRMQQLRSLEEHGKEDKLLLFYELLRSGASQGIFFVLTAFSRNELPGKYHPFIRGVALNLNERSDYIDALNVRIPIAWGGIAACQGRGVIAIEDKKNSSESQILEIQVALYATAASDTERSEAIKRLGEDMRENWHGELPAFIARIPNKPILDDLLALPSVRQRLADPDYLPLGYVKQTGMPFYLDLGECFSMMLCGPTKSGKTTALKVLAELFDKRGAEIHVTGSSALIDWGRAQGYHAYDIPSSNQEPTPWGDFMEELFRIIVPERDHAFHEARKIGPSAEKECINGFTPIALLIDDFNLCMEKNEGVLQMYSMLQYCFNKNVRNYKVFLFISLSHSSYRSNRSMPVVAAATKYRHGMMLQGNLNECDPFDVAVPYSEKKLVYPKGEALLVSELESSRIVLPQLERSTFEED